MIYIYGAGGMGRELAAEMRHIYREICFIDDAQPSRALYTVPKDSEVLVAVGDSRVRERMMQAATKHGLEVMGWQTPHGLRASLQGSLVMQGVIITTDVELGRGVLVNTGAIISHDCKLDDFASVMPGVHMTGRVHVGKHAYVGIGATLVCRSNSVPLIIGEGATVGAGAVVLEDVPPGATVVGSPARIIKRAAA